jgi:hypothetical protein
MTYSDLLLCFVFVLLVYLLLEVKELRNLVRTIRSERNRDALEAQPPSV